MSKVGKFLKKVFKPVIKLVKKVIVPVAAVAAVVFTAGAALATFAPASALASSALGQAVIGASQAIGTFATSVWTSVTKAVGTATAKVKGFLGIGGAAGAGGAGGAGAIAGGAPSTLGLGGTTGGAVAGAGSGAAAAKAGMSLTDKLLLGSTVASTAGALTAPDEEDIAKASAKYRGHQGAFYGIDPGGTGGGAGEITPLQVPGQAPVAPQKPADLFAEQVQPTSPLTPRVGVERWRPQAGQNLADLFSYA